MKHFPIHRTRLFVVLTGAFLLALLVGPIAIAGNNDDLIDVSYAADPFAIDSWLQQAKLSASDGADGDIFGQSVAISGDTVLVAPSANNGKGIVYVFEKSGEDWMNTTEIARLTASDGVDGDYFGSSVAISGNTVVVGAAEDDSGKGSAYVFEKPSGGWVSATETAKLSASDGKGNDDCSLPECDYFGSSVAINGGTVVVGAWGDDTWKGSAYVFEKPGGGWGERHGDGQA